MHAPAIRLRVCALLALATAAVLLAACGGSGSAGGEHARPAMPYLGILQFDVRHNLDDPSCLEDGDCTLSLENEGDPAAWLEQIASWSDLAVLHWDRSLPWLAFAAAPPPGVGRVEFYDERLDPVLRRWLDAFAHHFARMPKGYLAVTPLNGLRDALSPARIDEVLTEVEVGGRCPDLAPGTVLTIEYEREGVARSETLDLERTYENFVLYLIEKLQPDYVALLIEADMFRRSCPERWPGLVELYQAVHDRVRSATPSATRLFATLTYEGLLGFDDARCAPARFAPCAQGPPPQPAAPQPQACFPLEPEPLTDLAAGERMDLLALSFYPDSLHMATGIENLQRTYPSDWDGAGPCAHHAADRPFLDPFAALDRLGWSKPIAIAESAARSCDTLASVELPEGALFFEFTGDTTSQAFWLEHELSVAEERRFDFYVHAMLRDYAPLRPWVARQGVLDAATYSVFNAFPCMGLLDETGHEKAPVTAVWQAHRR